MDTLKEGPSWAPSPFPWLKVPQSLHLLSPSPPALWMGETLGWERQVRVCPRGFW